MLVKSKTKIIASLGSQYDGLGYKSMCRKSDLSHWVSQWLCSPKFIFWSLISKVMEFESLVFGRRFFRQNGAPEWMQHPSKQNLIETSYLFRFVMLHWEDSHRWGIQHLTATCAWSYNPSIMRNRYLLLL